MWDDMKSRANAERAAFVDNAAREADERARAAEALGTPTPEAVAMRPDFDRAVSEFVRLMPRSASKKDFERRRFGFGRRFHYLRDDAATSAEIRRTDRSAYVGAHVFLDGAVRCYGMGLGAGADPRVRPDAMAHVMRLMAVELARRDLL